MREMKTEIFTFSECFKMIENLYIYKPRNRVNLEIMHRPNKLPNRLGN